jgi:hypothetical protein
MSCEISVTYSFFYVGFIKLILKNQKENYLVTFILKELGWYR